MKDTFDILDLCEVVSELETEGKSRHEIRKFIMANFPVKHYPVRCVTFRHRLGMRYLS